MNDKHQTQPQVDGWAGTVLQVDLALEAEDVKAAVTAHARLSRLAGKKPKLRAVVHDYGNAIQRLIFDRYLDAEHQEYASDLQEAYAADVGAPAEGWVVRGGRDAG